MTALSETSDAAPSWAGVFASGSGFAHVRDVRYWAVDVARCGVVVRPAESEERLTPCPACHGGER
ncbi:hypothetical protein FHR81_000801 [Actinoalloteichus hoggarensis]|uniref:Uncharacterized protein n=1 Tax=Actinoalloteichus hoggarensis TaxID=1470176 RepID=A0A221W1T5_9PSEU|nr:hypothetical protein [Actinoalloteichus hoggarensis]ASO19521.1 hypothetical protein AHOG_09385 [Actinoalloteichus hoggarensis]MBB5919772.1 hypothetical protein [Actinoalloteichus hoggarensis]